MTSDYIELTTANNNRITMAFSDPHPFGRSKKYQQTNSKLGYRLISWVDENGEINHKFEIMSSWYLYDNKTICYCKTWAEVLRWVEEHIDEIEAEVREAEEKFKKDK